MSSRLRLGYYDVPGSGAGRYESEFRVFEVPSVEISRNKDRVFSSLRNLLDAKRDEITKVGIEVRPILNANSCKGIFRYVQIAIPDLVTAAIGFDRGSVASSEFILNIAHSRAEGDKITLGFGSVSHSVALVARVPLVEVPGNIDIGLGGGVFGKVNELYFSHIT